MIRSSIKSIEELQLIKAEKKATLTHQEVEIKAKFEAVKEQLFSLDSLLPAALKEGKSAITSKLLSGGISRFIVNKWLKPKSKLLRKAGVFFSSIILNQLINFVGERFDNELKKLK